MRRCLVYRITYLVDPDTRTYTSEFGRSSRTVAVHPATVQDIRRVLEDKNVDVVSIATPNHWHSLMTIWALPGRQGRLRREALQPQHS